MSHDVSVTEENRDHLGERFEHRLEGSEGGRLFQAEGRASAKVLRRKHLMSWRKSKRLMGLEWKEWEGTIKRSSGAGMKPGHSVKLYSESQMLAFTLSEMGSPVKIFQQKSNI